MIATQVIGRLGKDAEVKEINGRKVINFSIAVDTGYGQNKKTLWIECGKWGDNTAVAQYLVKGSQVHVAGEPSLREWDSNGKSGVSFQLNVQQITLVGGKNEQVSPGQAYTPPAPQNTDDLPF